MAEASELSESVGPSRARSFEPPPAEIRRRLETIDRRVRRLVVRRPLAAIALAIGTGYLLGRALRRAR